MMINIVIIGCKSYHLIERNKIQEEAEEGPHLKNLEGNGYNRMVQWPAVRAKQDLVYLVSNLSYNHKSEEEISYPHFFNRFMFLSRSVNEQDYGSSKQNLALTFQLSTPSLPKNN